MDKNEQVALCEIIEMIQDEIRELKASQLAVLEMLSDISPHVSEEIRKAIFNYKNHRSKIMENLLLALEERNPARAALLDIHRPLVSPDEEGPEN